MDEPRLLVSETLVIGIDIAGDDQVSVMQVGRWDGSKTTGRYNKKLCERYSKANTKELHERLKCVKEKYFKS